MQPIDKKSFPNISAKVWQALGAWCLFILLAILVNRVFPIIFRLDTYTWTYSAAKSILFRFFIYGGVFFLLPLLLEKGWQTILRLEFLLPLVVAMIGISLSGFISPFAAVTGVLIFAYLHWRVDLSSFGIRSYSWKGDLAAVLLIGCLGVVQVLLRPVQHPFDFPEAVSAGLNRWFANPASTVEVFFYFGFLTERLSVKFGKLTPLLIGAMYTIHEMTNPEYWYKGLNFMLVFIGIAIFAQVYLWRRSIVVLWLGDGLQRLITGAF